MTAAAAATMMTTTMICHARRSAPRRGRRSMRLVSLPATCRSSPAAMTSLLRRARSSSVWSLPMLRRARGACAPGLSAWSTSPHAAYSVALQVCAIGAAVRTLVRASAGWRGVAVEPPHPRPRRHFRGRHGASRSTPADFKRVFTRSRVIQGLGKTFQVAAFLSGLLRGGAAKRALVVAPTTLQTQWMRCVLCVSCCVTSEVTMLISRC